MKMNEIPCKGGVRGGVSKPVPEIPLIVEPIKYWTSNLMEHSID